MSKGCYVAFRTLLRVCLSAEQMQVQVGGGGGEIVLQDGLVWAGHMLNSICMAMERLKL